MPSRKRYCVLPKNSHLLLLCCLQLLHGLIVTVVYLLLEKLTMVLHRLHLLCPALLLSGQLLQTQTHRKSKLRRTHVSRQHLQRTTIHCGKQLASCVHVLWHASMKQTDLCVLYLHFRIQSFIQLANLLSELLHVVGLVQDVRVHLEGTCKNVFVFILIYICDAGHQGRQRDDLATCSQDSSKLSFVLANWLFSSSTSLISFLRSICNTKLSSVRKFIITQQQNLISNALKTNRKLAK